MLCKSSLLLLLLLLLYFCVLCINYHTLFFFCYPHTYATHTHTHTNTHTHTHTHTHNTHTTQHTHTHNTHTHTQDLASLLSSSDTRELILVSFGSTVMRIPKQQLISIAPLNCWRDLQHKAKMAKRYCTYIYVVYAHVYICVVYPHVYVCVFVCINTCVVVIICISVLCV